METEIRFEPTLFVFLGTSSAQIGWRLKNMLRQAYGDVPVLRFLWVDTDNDVDPSVARWFSTLDRAVLAGFNGDEVLASLSVYPAIRNWWPRDSRLKPGFIRRGANQIRLYGRLALFRMFNDRNTGPAFIDKLRAHLDALQQIENYDATERMSHGRFRYIVERENVRVVFFFSTCGGTGSGISFDIAYLCRDLLKNNNPTLIGLALLPPVMDKAIKNETHTQWEKIRANTYAWFKEHEYLLGNPHWRVAYPEGAPVSVQAPPFDLTFVLDLGNQAGDRLSCEDDIFSMAAQAIFLDTGSPIGGAMRGFNANVSVLLEEFQNRQRAYSALAAASLVFPAEKILNYCGARLGQAMIRDGLLAKPDPLQVVEAASALLGRLELRDAKLLEILLCDRQLPNPNAPAIRKASTLDTIRNLVVTQEARDQRERIHQTEQIAAQAITMLNQIQQSLQSEIAAMVLKRGACFTQAVLNLLTGNPSFEAVPEETASLIGLKVRLAQQGASEADLAHTQAEYQAMLQRLRVMEGEVWHAAYRALFKKAWRRDLDRARSDSLHWMGEVNQLTLQLAAQREAANLYDQLVEVVHAMQDTLSGIIQTANRAVETLENFAQENLDPDGLEQGIYELSLEAVDGDFIKAYHKYHSAHLDPAATYRAFSEELSIQDLQSLSAWTEKVLAAQLIRHAQTYFTADLENTSLLEALAQYHGDQAPQVIEAMFDRLVRYCHPFWQYNRDSGIQGQEGKSIIGVEDEHHPLIPDKYRTNLQYEIKSTGFKHRIDVARVQHGLPAFLLRGMPDYKAYYDVRRKGLDPLHILPEATLAEPVIPEEKQEARQTFAVSAAFGYLVQIGSYYYFDEHKEYSSRNIHPGRENRLDQGRENAEEAFIQRDDLMHLVEQHIEADIASMGNRAAITLLQQYIDGHKRAISQMSPENDLRRQFEKEIRALKEKQYQLGYVDHEIPLAA